MPQIKFSETALLDLQRLHAFLEQIDPRAAANAVDEILNGIEHLYTLPFIGGPVDQRPKVRKLVVEFGTAGYLVFYKFYEEADFVLVSTILHQKELYDPQLIGLIEEQIEEGQI
jgi:plasmid stabilization system protein ParE